MKSITILSVLILMCNCFAQQDIDLSQEEWESIRDQYAVQAIIMLAKIDTLNLEIDSLKQVIQLAENLDCEEELYKIVGASKEEVEDFRRKFGITENKINGKIGTPDDARKMYFDEISASKIRCLPEFSDRYFAMNKKLEPWYSQQTISNITGQKTYTVVEGDNLKKISRIEYGTSNLWMLIWEANRESVLNSDDLFEHHKKKISNPNLIYPGQILRIPPDTR